MITEKYQVEHSVLRNYFKKLNILFIESLKIDKELFSFSIRKRVPIPFLRKQVDYLDLRERGQQILAALEEIQEDLSQFVFEKAEMKKLAKIMHGYALCFIKAQEALNTLCYRMYLKSEGIQDIDDEEFIELCNAYFSLDAIRDNHYAKQMDLIAEQLGFQVLHKQI